MALSNECSYYCMFFADVAFSSERITHLEQFEAKKTFNSY